MKIDIRIEVPDTSDNNDIVTIVKYHLQSLKDDIIESFDIVESDVIVDYDIEE